MNPTPSLPRAGRGVRHFVSRRSWLHLVWHHQYEGLASRSGAPKVANFLSMLPEGGCRGIDGEFPGLAFCFDDPLDRTRQLIELVVGVLLVGLAELKETLGLFLCQLPLRAGLDQGLIPTAALTGIKPRRADLLDLERRVGLISCQTGRRATRRQCKDQHLHQPFCMQSCRVHRYRSHQGCRWF